jgi:hypothetical protein
MRCQQHVIWRGGIGCPALLALILGVLGCGGIADNASSPSRTQPAAQAMPSQRSAQNASSSNASPLQQCVHKFLEEFYTCRLQAVLDITRGGSMATTRTRVAQAKATLLPLYAAAKDALGQNLSAITLLKDLYAAWLGALDALSPSPGETDNAYHVRISGLQNKLSEMGHRVEVEAQ